MLTASCGDLCDVYRLPWRGHACKYLWLVDTGKVVTWSCGSSLDKYVLPPHPGALEQDLYKTASWLAAMG